MIKTTTGPVGRCIAAGYSCALFVFVLTQGYALMPPGFHEHAGVAAALSEGGVRKEDANAQHLGDVPRGAYNLCDGYEERFRQVERAVARAHPEQFQPGAKERIAQTNEMIRVLRSFGAAHSVRGPVLYPASGFDPIAPLAIIQAMAEQHKAPLLFVNVSVERFGAFSDIATFLRSAVHINDALVSDFGMIFPQYDTVTVYGRMMQDYNLRGGGMIGIMRLMLYFGAHIDGIYYFSILDDGSMRFCETAHAHELEQYGAHAVVSFTIPSSHLRGTYVHISQNLFQRNLGYERCIRSVRSVWGCALIKAALSIYNIPYNFVGSPPRSQHTELTRRHTLWRNCLEPVIDSNPDALVIADPDLQSDTWNRRGIRHIFRREPIRVPLEMSVGYRAAFDIAPAREVLSLADVYDVPGMGYMSAERIRLAHMNRQLIAECECSP